MKAYLIKRDKKLPIPIFEINGEVPKIIVLPAGTFEESDGERTFILETLMEIAVYREREYGVS